MPIDGSCDDELSVKGLSSEDLVIGNWEREEPASVIEAQENTKIDEADDENSDVFFIELEGATLQVGHQKKRKKESTQSSQRKPTTCSVCHQQGHNKSNKKCPNSVC